MYHRIAHLLKEPIVKQGNWVKKGQLIGFIGSTGSSSGDHCHYDVSRYLNHWTEYTKGMSWKRVRDQYVDPAPYMKEGLPALNLLPDNGYKFLQWTGKLYHSGCDINSTNDRGKEVYAPVDGQVVYVTHNVWGAGWGHMLIIEEETGTKETLLAEAGKHKTIYEDIEKDIGILVPAIEERGYTITDILNSYTHKYRTGNHIFDFTEERV